MDLLMVKIFVKICKDLNPSFQDQKYVLLFQGQIQAKVLNRTKLKDLT